MGKRILVLCTTDSMIYHFLIPHIMDLKTAGNEVICACSRTGSFFDELKKRYGLKVVQIDFERSPYHPHNIPAYKRLSRLIEAKKIDVIFCHEPVGGAMGRIAGYAHHCKVVYMAHGFHFHRDSSRTSWLIYYPIEKMLSRFTDVLITINRQDYQLARETFHAGKVRYVHGIGINEKIFQPVASDESDIRKKIGISLDDIMWLSVGELNSNKNHAAVIKAIAVLKDPKIHYCIAGEGELLEELRRLSKELHLEKQIHLLGYRNDIHELLAASDLFIFPSFREGLSVALMEAIVCKVPVLCSRIRGNEDLVKDPECFFDPADHMSIVKCVRTCIPDRTFTRRSVAEMMEKSVENNYRNINRYRLENVRKELDGLF